MEFRYRYVNFGTAFVRREGIRQADNHQEPQVLHKNELALDVGGMCSEFKENGEKSPPVIDHHFHRDDGQFPSATAAVLHKAKIIRSNYAKANHEVIWLVTHIDPDFDAFCSMYLARVLIEEPDLPDLTVFGLNADGWLDTGDSRNGPPRVRKIDWYNANFHGVPQSLRWLFFLASFAACVDNGRRIACPKDRALHSVLYAAIRRGRNYMSDVSGAREFFDELKRILEGGNLNPLYDSVFEASQIFQPELAMLDRELTAYDRDLQRARKVIVYLQHSSEFSEFYSRVQGTPLLTEQRGIHPEHLMLDADRGHADGVYIRDPECLLFKEWARTDIANSSLGNGFTFTAVVYSNGRADGKFSKANYFFAIDPEKANGRHLYPLWARLQSAEVQSMWHPALAAFREERQQAEGQAKKETPATTARPGYEVRAGAYAAFFDDPWFDGSNYQCTIIATPNRGALIGAPYVPTGLLDDPVIRIARQELEDSIYRSDASSGKVEISDLPASDEQKDSHTQSHEIGEAHVPPPAKGYFRFGKIQLHDDVILESSQVATQVAEKLWQILVPDFAGGLPADFLPRHLLVHRNWLGIWSRRGIMVAFKANARDHIKLMEDRYREMIALTRDVDSFSKRTELPIDHKVKTGEELARRAALNMHEMTLPENRLLGRFFEAINLAELLQTLRDLTMASNTATIADVQTKVEWLEIFLVGFYGTELAHIVIGHLKFPSNDSLYKAVLTVVVGALFTGLTAWLLAPWKHKRSIKLVWILVLAGACYVAAVVMAILFAHQPNTDIHL